MIRLASLFWLLLVAGTGAAMFTVSYQVQGLDDALAQTRKAELEEQHEIRMLTAEWAYLNRPDALAEMNQRYLSLGPIATKQLRTAIADIPLRPPTAPDIAVAGVPPPTAPAAPAMAVAVAPPRVEPIPTTPPGETLDALFARIAETRR
jgi:hypothetical protein